MSIDFKKAITVPFSDSQWPKKLGIAVLLLLPALVSSIIAGSKHPLVGIFSFIAGFIVAGYALLAGQNQIKGVSPLLPEWDFVKAFIVAIKSSVINIAYILMLLPIVVIIIAVTAAVPTFSLLSVILGIIISVLAVIIISIALSLYIEDFELAQAFNFKKILSIFKNSSVEYMAYLGWSILVGIIYGLITGVVGGVASIASPSLAVLISDIATLLVTITTVNLLAQAFMSVNLNVEE